jgi:hypothetical protein
VSNGLSAPHREYLAPGVMASAAFARGKRFGAGLAERINIYATIPWAASLAPALWRQEP